MENIEPSFLAAVPGSGLTSEPGSQAYKNPPQYSTVDDAIDYYVNRLASDELAEQVITVLDMGVSVTDLAHIMQMHGVMEGKHTIDVSMLILPVLMEVIALIGDTANIEYSMGTEEDPERSNHALVESAKLKMQKELKQKTLDGFSKDIKPEEAPEPEAEEPATEPTGLMARRI